MFLLLHGRHVGAPQTRRGTWDQWVNDHCSWWRKHDLIYHCQRTPWLTQDVCSLWKWTAQVVWFKVPIRTWPSRGLRLVTDKTKKTWRSFRSYNRALKLTCFSPSTECGSYLRNIDILLHVRSQRLWLHSLHSVGLAWFVIGDFCLPQRKKIPGNQTNVNLDRFRDEFVVTKGLFVLFSLVNSYTPPTKNLLVNKGWLRVFSWFASDLRLFS